MRIGFSFKTETIEKSTKGVRRSKHKYIRVFTGNDGKDRYLYPEDMGNPFKLLLSVFTVTKEKISKMFTDNTIEKEYGVDENVFAAHVLEYLTARSKWDKFFSNPTVSHENIKPVNLNKKKAAAKKKETENKFTINRSLMRKIWAVFNPVEEAKQEAEYEKITVTLNREEFPNVIRVYGQTAGQVAMKMAIAQGIQDPDEVTLNSILLNLESDLEMNPDWELEEDPTPDPTMN